MCTNISDNMHLTILQDSASQCICGGHLLQGRTSWWNPILKNEEEEDIDEDEEKEEPEEPEPEVGPPLLTPLSEDAEVNGMAAWTTQLSSRLVPQFALAVIHSCLWPGAHAIAYERSVTAFI